VSVNKAAQALGRMGKGKAKTLTQAERKRRARRLADARKTRWPSTSNGIIWVAVPAALAVWPGHWLA